jgi:DNA topoisomerase I
MAKHLVIVESPAKAKTINKYLGKEYTVKASMGHVRDLVKSKLGIDLENDFQPQYVNSREKAKVIKELKEEAKKSDDVILALDPDREGEAIAWHLRELLKKEVGGDEKFTRVTYNQITKPAILQAFAEPGSLNMQKFEAQQARRVLDRLVGYQVSPLLWRRIRGGSSAGRVQTVALRLVCEREKAITSFVSEKYWILGARVAKQVDPKEPFEIRLLKVDGKKGEIKDAELVRELLEDLKSCSLTVGSIKSKETKRSPQPPFITSTLQQAASSAFGFQPGRTMALAQKLYEGVDLGNSDGPVGLITYMRTDSVSLAGDAVAETRENIRRIYGEDYLPAKPVAYRSRGSAQEAHEAIRPTDIARTPDSLRGVLNEAEMKLYSLIWKRTIACQMAPARIEQTTVDINTDSKAHQYIFRANASKILFPGYMAAWGRGLSEDEEETESTLPPLAEGEPLDLLEWLPEEKETQPPKRYSEAALIKALEENGVGRPSTYATIITTLYNREYVERENKSLRPTNAGMEVNDFLIGRLPDLFEVKFTARMEEELDGVEEGKVHWTEMMRGFYNSLEQWLETAKAQNVDGDELKALLGLAAEIRDFKPPVKIGKKIYDDQNFVREISEAYEEKGEVTERQMEYLRKIVARYPDQIKALTSERAEELGLTALIASETEANKPPDETTWQKLAMLDGLEFAPPRKIGKKTYNDADFARSLREQVESGKRLTDNQVYYLEKLILKYGAQIEDFENRAAAAGIATEVEEDHESGPLLELLENVKTFKEPTVRGKRTWDDSEFADSLRAQYAARKSLTVRQRAALKKVLARYHEQIPGYAEKQEELSLPAPGAATRKGAKKKVQDW